MISGATRLAGIIGDPVRHSLSPPLHNAAYRELGLDWRYVAFEVPDGSTAGALDALRTLGLVGLSVTMPHKTAAAIACDTLSDFAARLRSVNTVTLQADGSLAGDSTDGEGFVRALREAGHDLAGAEALVLGAGGAARPVVVALADAGVAVSVTARRTGAAEAAAALVDAPCVAWTDRNDAARGRHARGERDAHRHGRRRAHRSTRARCGRVRSSPISSTTRSRRRCSPRPERPARIPSTGSGCSSTRPPSRSSAGPGRSRPSRSCGRRCATRWRNQREALNFRVPAAEVSVSGGDPCSKERSTHCHSRKCCGSLLTRGKTGALRMDAGVAATWWLVDGVCCAAEGGDLVEPVTDVRELLARMVDIGFVVARHAGGTFRFVADETPRWESEVRLEVDAVLIEIDGLLDQWREIEVVIPSLECRPVLCDELGTDRLEVDAETWRLIVQIDRRRTVRDLAHRTSRSVFELCRTLIELVEIGAVTITPEVVVAPSPSQSARRGTSTAAVGAAGARSVSPSSPMVRASSHRIRVPRRPSRTRASPETAVRCSASSPPCRTEQPERALRAHRATGPHQGCR